MDVESRDSFEFGLGRGRGRLRDRLGEREEGAKGEEEGEEALGVPGVGVGVL